jgi:formyl-CoA transferase
MRMARPAAIFSRTPSKIPRGALPPKYGEHGSELLEEMGYSADEIALLREQGVLK